LEGHKGEMILTCTQYTHFSAISFKYINHVLYFILFRNECHVSQSVM
jgi:hypothetical protein